jgi:hypothetical protein
MGGRLKCPEPAMTPRLAELLAAMVEAVIAADLEAAADERVTIRNAGPRRRAGKRVAQEEGCESRERR